jgi:hypothetical protein
MKMHKINMEMKMKLGTTASERCHAEGGKNMGGK